MVFGKETQKMERKFSEEIAEYEYFRFVMLCYSLFHGLMNKKEIESQVQFAAYTGKYLNKEFLNQPNRLN